MLYSFCAYESKGTRFELYSLISVDGNQKVLVSPFWPDAGSGKQLTSSALLCSSFKHVGYGQYAQGEAFRGTRRKHEPTGFLRTRRIQPHAPANDSSSCRARFRLTGLFTTVEGGLAERHPHGNCTEERACFAFQTCNPLRCNTCARLEGRGCYMKMRPPCKMLRVWSHSC